MIGFLYPVFGLAVLAAAVPIVLHLIRRREVRRLVFPAIRYIRRAEQRQAQRLRLRHLALLAARLLIILALAAAAAGPLVGRGGAADHWPTALALVIDESLSSTRVVADRRLLDLYVERAGLSIELADADDRIAIFSAVRSGDGVVALGRHGALRYLHALQATAGVADLPAALDQAAAWLESAGDRAREIHLFTDLQRVSLQTERQETGRVGAETSVIVYRPELPPLGNGTLANAMAEVVPLDAGQPTRVTVPLVWFGPDPPIDPVIVRVVVDDEVTAVAESRFGEPALFTLPPRPAGWVQGRVEIDHHGLVADDRRYFSWPVRPPPSVGVAGEIGPFLDRALEALEQGGRLRRGTQDTAEVWLSGAAERVADALARGRTTIVVPPASALDLPRLNLRLEEARVPWRYEVDEAAGARRLADSPLAGLTEIDVRLAYRLRQRPAAEGDSVLLRLDDGAPWLVRGTAGAGAFLLLGSPLVETASDLPLSAAMVPFIDALIGDWASQVTIAPTIVEGVAQIRLSGRARRISLPDGSERPVEGGAPFVGNRPGNYAVLDSGEVTWAFSVNAPLAEADLAPGRPADLERWLAAARWSWVSGADRAEWGGSVFQARRGRHAWRPLVVLLLLVSIVEATLAAAGRRKDSKPGRPA